jgi:hypothetical protein
MFFGMFGFLGRCPRLHVNVAPLALSKRNSLGHSFRLRRQCFQEWRTRKRQSPEQIPQGRGRTVGEADSFPWDANSVPYRFRAVHTGDTRQLSLEMRDRARRRVVCIEITESPAHQSEQFRLAMIALGANLNQLNKIRRGLRTQIIAANSGERIFQDDFRERMQIGFATSHDRNLSLKKQIELSGKRTFLTECAFGDRLNAA